MSRSLGADDPVSCTVAGLAVLAALWAGALAVGAVAYGWTHGPGWRRG